MASVSTSHLIGRSQWPGSALIIAQLIRAITRCEVVNGAIAYLHRYTQMWSLSLHHFQALCPITLSPVAAKTGEAGRGHGPQFTKVPILVTRFLPENPTHHFLVEKKQKSNVRHSITRPSSLNLAHPLWNSFRSHWLHWRLQAWASPSNTLSQALPGISPLILSLFWKL